MKSGRMVRRIVLGAVLMVAAILHGCGGDGDGNGPIVPLELVLNPVADGFNRPNYVTSAGDGSGRLFVVEQGGRIRIINANRQVLATPFLDLSGIVDDRGEAGLLSVAFHPNYERNGRLFVYFLSQRDGRLKSYVSEFTVSSGNANRVDPGSERVLIELNQPGVFHNGGLVTFGPDGFLWIGLGDGGGAQNRDEAQNLGSLFGSILRIDVNRGNPYAIPPGNPFVGRQGARPEIYAYGFRNPWRFSLDQANGRLFVGDVGENTWEEINLVAAGGNYGWPIMEGPDCFPPGTNCDRSGLRLPIHAYQHGQGGVCSVTAGYVYRGARYPALRGTYFFADYCSGIIWRLRQSGGQWQATQELDSNLRISSFGVDEAGEMYAVDLNGGVYRMDFL
jgi:glucose/arabinose dehydrogenase